MSETENQIEPVSSTNPDLRWYVVHAYSGMEKAVERNIVERINREIKAILEEPESEKFFEVQKNDRFYSTPEEFRKLIVTDIQRYGKIIQETGANKQK